MQVAQTRWSASAGWEKSPEFAVTTDLVLVFADADFFHTEECYAHIRKEYPNAHIAGCSSSGSVMGCEISDGDIVVTAIKFDHSKVRMTVADLDEGAAFVDTGKRLMTELNDAELRHVFVLSDGLLINGSELAQGLNQFGIPVTGGLAGDSTRFAKTWIMADAPARSGRVAALGFYGNITIKSGCFAGWEDFGAERIVTKSTANVVYEIDEQPALALYKKYLGELAHDLPASGLRFPLSIRANNAEQAIIRTLLAIDEATNSLTFAGDVPQGYLCKLMKTNLDNLIDHAGLAAEATQPRQSDATGLGIVVSCVGRRLVMGQLTEDELEIVQDKLGEATAITGFYSYGELAPFSNVLQCQLHNQTMTLTTFYE